MIGSRMRQIAASSSSLASRIEGAGVCMRSLTELRLSCEREFLTNPGNPPPAYFPEIRNVRRILPQELLFYDTPQHEGDDKSYGDGQVERRKSAENEGKQRDESTGV